MSRGSIASAWVRAFPVAALAAGLAGCTVGPDYRRPTVPVPAHWSEAAASEHAASPVPADWWKLYGDPKLDALIRRALRANLDLAGAADRMREARAMLRAQRAASWPRVDATAAATRGQASANAPGVSPFAQGGELGSGASPQNLFQAGFDASWELDLFGGTRRAVEAARAEAQGTAFERDAVALSLTAEVARSYVELRDNQTRLALASQSVAVAREMLAMVRSRNAGGLATDLDLAAAEARLHDAEAAVPGWETRCKQAIHRLGVLVGAPPEALDGELAADQPLRDDAPTIAAGLPSDLLRRRPDLRRAERQLAAATARIGVATAELYPRFSLDASAGLASFMASDFADPHSAIWSLGPALSWPIFRAGRIKATIEVRDLQARQALLAYRQAILLALEDVENALASYRGERQRHDRLAAMLGTRRRALDHARALYRGGLSDFRDVLDRQQDVLQAQGELARSTAAEWTDLIALCKALGGGWNTPARPADAAAPAARGHG